MADNLDLNEIRAKLQERRTTLLVRLGSEAGGEGTPDVYNPDKSDLAQEYVRRDRDTALIEHMEESLEQVEAALNRLDEGSYGKCTRCGREIAAERLEALPYAELCIQCQKLLERNY